MLLLAGLTAGTSCILTTAARSPKREQERPGTDVLSVFLTGNELGALKPCGCFGGQLGGLDRRAAVLNRVPEERRLIVDTGSFVKTDSDQDLIKFNIIVQALGMLDYDLVCLSEKDVEIGNNLGLLEVLGSFFSIISPHTIANVDVPATFTRTASLDGRTMAVTVAAFDTKSAPTEKVRELFSPQAEQQAVGILVVNHCDQSFIDFIAKEVSAVDCIVCPSEGDEPMLIGDPDGRPLVLSVGRFGRYICELQIKTGLNRAELRFQAIAVTEDLKQNPELINLYKDYQQIVKERNLLEKHLRVPLPDGLQYVGSESCESCHQYEYVVWKGNPHGDAYATLEEVGSQYDPECVVCHVIGLDYESGFASEKSTPHLKNVGCENCHGPCSEHNKNPYTALTPVTEPKKVCITCHTPEHSSDYAGNEEEKLRIINHWPEPNDLGDVK